MVDGALACGCDASWLRIASRVLSRWHSASSIASVSRSTAATCCSSTADLSLLSALTCSYVALAYSDQSRSHSWQPGNRISDDSHIKYRKEFFYNCGMWHCARARLFPDQRLETKIDKPYCGICNEKPSSVFSPPDHELRCRLARMRSTTGFHPGVIGLFKTSTTPNSLVASSTDVFIAPAIAIINRSGFASCSL